MKVIVFLCNSSVFKLSHGLSHHDIPIQVVVLHCRSDLCQKKSVTMDITEELKKRTNVIQTITMHTAGEVGR